MKELLSQFFSIWGEIKSMQRIVVIAIVLFMCMALGYLFVRSTVSRYVPLSLPTSELPSVRTYLDSVGIAYKEHPEKGLLILREQFDRVRTDLAVSDSLQHDQGKGFELFDTNTWIKGEKELQVLEMRALKGQLEKDLASFDQIKSARVILDMAPGRSLGSAPYKTKASVILTLMPHTFLSVSQLQAITYHLAGAVRGLEPNMIAISDTTGKLYKAIDPEAKETFSQDSRHVIEQQLEQKLHAFLAALLGERHFFISVQTSIEHSHSFSIAVAIDKEYEAWMEDIYKQLHMIASGYEIPFQLEMHAIAFEKKEASGVVAKNRGGYIGLTLTLIFISLACLSLYPLFRRYTQKKREDSLFRTLTRIDIGKLAESIQGEDPEVIALMLSYLEPARAEKIMASFPETVQEQVFVHLGELEKET